MSDDSGENETLLRQSQRSPSTPRGGGASAGDQPCPPIDLNDLKLEFRSRELYDVAGWAAILGVMAGGGIVGGLTVDFWTFCVYIAALGVFHIFEFLPIAKFDTSLCTTNSFLINHSRAYTIAITAAMVEYWFEYWFTSIPKSSFLSFIGLVMVIGGQSIRTAGMFTAQHNFTHIVATVKRKDHKLVTNGIFGYIRHPAYAGWYWFVVGTQLLMNNPICTIAYAASAWLFFKDRITTEEEALCDFFPEYPQYRQRVKTWIPFL